jgi:hypothetical protein
MKSQYLVALFISRPTFSENKIQSILDYTIPISRVLICSVFDDISSYQGIYTGSNIPSPSFSGIHDNSGKQCKPIQKSRFALAGAPPQTPMISLLRREDDASCERFFLSRLQKTERFTAAWPTSEITRGFRASSSAYPR